MKRWACILVIAAGCLGAPAQTVLPPLIPDTAQQAIGLSYEQRLAQFTDFTGGPREPVPLNLGKVLGEIAYSKSAHGIDGKVVVRVLLDENGHYVKHLVLKDPHPLLTKPVEKVLPSLRFKPAYQDGVAIPFWVTIPFQPCWRE